MKYFAVTFTCFLASHSLVADPETQPGEKVEASYWEQAKKMYEELISEDRDLKEESKKWLSDDISRIGDWQYQVVILDESDPLKVTEELNKLGEERWECFFVDELDGKLAFYFKKERISYLQKISELKIGRLIGGDEK
tara:strand:+ start:89 stop:502 length:414 start_codon:yes stop_codon:yes gene_type:complete